MSLPGYAEYKDSGVAWLGKIPAHWETRWLGSIASDQGSVFIDGDWIESKDISDEGYKYLTSGNVGEGFYKEQGLGFVSEKTFAELNCTEVLPGDILISRLNLPIARACIVPDFGCRIVTCVDNVIVRPNPNFERQYVIFMMSSKQHFANMENLARGTTMQRISRSTLSRVRFAFPPPQEQTAIATFLDRETAKIDELIAEQEKLIALLAEKRQATISHAVTKGLNPAAPMKDSGVPYLGVVPANWTIKKIKNVVSMRSGEGITSEDIENEGAFPVYGGNGLRGYTNRLTHTGEYLLVGRQGALCGNVHHITGEFWASEHAVVCTFITNDIPRWAFYMLGFMDLGQYSVSAAQPGLAVERIQQLSIAVPPEEEQRDIATFIDAEVARLEALTVEATHGIALLKERRSALISAAVTGKIDVRHVAEQKAA